MALTSCVREELLPSSGNGEEGERVKVELSFKIPSGFESAGTTIEKYVH